MIIAGSNLLRDESDNCVPTELTNMVVEVVAVCGVPFEVVRVEGDALSACNLWLPLAEIVELESSASYLCE